jgi:hypothetical protein
MLIDGPMNRSMRLWQCECFKAIEDGNEYLILSEAQCARIWSLVLESKSQIAFVLPKATRGFQKPGTRIDDTTNDVLIRFDWANAIVGESAV